MIIAITTNTLNFGGAERQRVTLANGLASAGFNVEIHVIQSLGPLAESVSKNVRVLNVKSPIAVPRRLREPTVLISGTTMTEIAYSFAWKARHPRRTRWIVAAHNPTESGVRTYSHLASRLMGCADLQVCLSERQALDLKQTDRFVARKTVIIPNGIDVSSFAQVHDARRDRVVGDPPVVGFVGRLVPQKGLDLLLRALGANTHHDWTLEISGEGPDREKLGVLAAELRLDSRITWYGSRDASTALRECDLLVVPSRNEAFPLIIMESIVAGVPIVATDVGSIKEIFGEHGVGTLTIPGVEGIGTAIDSSLSTIESLSREAWIAGSNAARTYSHARMVLMYEECIRKVARARWLE